MPRILAIDQSTSATKALIFDAHGALLGKASVAHKQLYPQPGWVEHDAEEIWQNTLAVLRTIGVDYPDLLSTVQWLSVTNQRETVVVFDRESGRPLHNAIVWQCRRGDAYCRQLQERGLEDDVASKTGLKIDTYFSASKIQWLIEHHPHIGVRLRDGSALVGTIDTYLVYRLTQGKVFATDHTNASRTLLYDIHQRNWDPELCRIFSVPPEALPEIRDCDANFGHVAIDCVLPVNLPITGIMGDSQASLFALGCYEPGDTKATFGTGSSLLLNIGPKPLAPRPGAVTTVAWVLGGRPTYCLEGIINYSAATVEWLRHQLQLIHDASDTAELATSVEDNGGVYLVPAFAGLSAPYWNADARAAIVGMSAHSTRAHVVRASLESIAYQIRDVLDMLGADAGVKTTQVRADGGATRNRFLMQFTADIVGRTLQTSNVAESSPLGAALCGAIGQGVYRDATEIASNLKITDVEYTPAMPDDQRSRYYAEWQRAVQRVL